MFLGWRSSLAKGIECGPLAVLPPRAARLKSGSNLAALQTIREAWFCRCAGVFLGLGEARESPLSRLL
jgi:hypothetical protein